MNKADLIDVVNEKTGSTKASSEATVNLILDTITEQLKAGNEVSLAGFGIFSVKNRAARLARNPKTGEKVQVPASRAPKFRPAKSLKEAVK